MHNLIDLIEKLPPILFCFNTSTNTLYHWWPVVQNIPDNLCDCIHSVYLYSLEDESWNFYFDGNSNDTDIEPIVSFSAKMPHYTSTHNIFNFTQSFKVIYTVEGLIKYLKLYIKHNPQQYLFSANPLLRETAKILL